MVGDDFLRVVFSQDDEDMGVGDVYLKQLLRYNRHTQGLIQLRTKA
jgi:hypothetical protein